MESNRRIEDENHSKYQPFVCFSFLSVKQVLVQGPTLQLQLQ